MPPASTLDGITVLPTLRFGVRIPLEVVSKVSDENHDAGEFEEAAVDLDEAFMADEQSPPVAEPCEEPFDLPAFAIAPERPAILKRFPFPSASMRADQFPVQMAHQFSEMFGIVGPVNDEPLWKAAVSSAPKPSPS